MIGPVECRYAICIDAGIDPYAMVDDVFLPLEVVSCDGGGWRPDQGSAFDVTGAEVSAVTRVRGALEVRVFNPTATVTTVSLPERSGWLVDLRGRPVASFDGSFSLRPFGIATVRLPD